MQNHTESDKGSEEDGIQFDELIEGPGNSFIGRKGRFLYIKNERTKDEQQQLLRAIVASKAELAASIETKIVELEQLIRQFSPFDLIATAYFQNLVFDPETYEEPLHKGRVAFVEYLALLLLVQEEAALNWNHITPIDGLSADRLNVLLDGIFRESIHLLIAGQIDPENLSTGDGVDELRLKTLLDSLVVRFPSYHHHARELLIDLFSPLASELLEKFGFRAFGTKDFISVEI